MPPKATRTSTRSSARQKIPSTRILEQIDATATPAREQRVATTPRRGGLATRARGAERPWRTTHVGRAASVGRATRAVTFEPVPPAPPKAQKSVDRPVEALSIPCVSLEDQADQLVAKLASIRKLQEAKSQRARLIQEVKGNDEDDNDDDEDAYDTTSNGVHVVEAGHRRRATSSVGPPRTHGWDGKPLSIQGLRREQGKKDLQRELKRRGRETPDTCDAQEYMDSEEIDFRVDPAAPHDYIVNFQLIVRINQAKVLTTARSDVKRSVVSNEGFEWVDDALQKVIEERIGDSDSDTARHHVAIKSLSGRVPITHEDVDDFGEETLSHAIKFTIEAKLQCADLTAAALPRKDLKRKADDSPALTPGERNDRTKQLRAQHQAERMEGYRVRANQLENLHNEWRCRDTSCPNNNQFCYFNVAEKPNAHFKLSAPDMDSWVSAIERADTGVSRYHPGDDMKARIYAKGPITRGQLESNKLTPAQRIRESEDKLADMRIKCEELRMRAEMSRLQERQDDRERRREEQEEEAERRREERQRQRDRDERQRQAEAREEERRREERQRQRDRDERQRQAEAREEERRVQEVRVREEAYRRQEIVHLNATRSTQSVNAAPSHQIPTLPSNPLPSCPFDSQEDEWNVVDAFFVYILSSVANQAARTELEHAREVAATNFWTLDDLKSMGIHNSDMYKEAIGEGLPYGILRTFGRRVKAFKSYYRASKQRREEIVAAERRRQEEAIRGSVTDQS
ncbi:hypothetical protein EJ04DRAFT_581309 [Polyplosphaeria fusca]|uniref:Uncharacterized protein n=1 Tax=Polyplosphaeria fusca TaxID=682080 RepID=A0A9P4QMS9_9PLEO|nr:hypothetical protein EJ04DRAFT_581309 [Polyplosphaeria fusca]